MTALADQLAEARAKGLPHATIADVAGLVEVDLPVRDALRAILQAYLAEFLPPGEACPLCGGSTFRWTDVHGVAACVRDGWPATVYHRLRDPADDPACGRCERPRSEHEQATVAWYVVDGPERGTTREEVEYRCPDQGDASPHRFDARVVLRFERALWAHPDAVETRGGS